MCMIGLSISLKTSYLFSLIACCQELTVSFSGSDNFLWANYEHLHDSTWISSGIINGIDHYIFEQEHAIWFVDGYWLMGPVDDTGTTNYYYMYTESSIPAKGKVPKQSRIMLGRTQIKRTTNYFEP